MTTDATMIITLDKKGRIVFDGDYAPIALRIDNELAGFKVRAFLTALQLYWSTRD